MESLFKRSKERLEKMKVPVKDHQISTEKQFDEGNQLESFLADDRLIMLCDGVFAIAITLLVINIKIPAGLTEDKFNAVLRTELFSQVLFYLITFLVIAGYWSEHRRLMKLIERIDRRFISLTFLFLAFIAFFPVTSSIVGEGYGYRSAVILYTLAFAGCGFSSLLLWLYASWHQRLIDPQMTQNEIISRAINIALAPTYFSLSLLLLFSSITPSNIFWTWLLLPFIVFVVRRIQQRWSAE
ncbi:MAG TPA: TMEM175 family protein [Ktedonobacteraceae bacterium]|nr:TMEM175 family protein [Ktedonobacteraceae bacterium]